MSADIRRALFIMFIAMSCIPAGDVAGKLLSGTYGVEPLFVAWSRFVIGGLLVLPFVPRGTWALLRDWRIWLRAGVLACGISSIQMALSTTPIATVFAAFFIAPIFSYILAVLFLREPVTLLRSVLIVLGFCGVLLVVRPTGTMEPGLLWAVTAGLFYGTFLTMSRWLGGIAPPLALTFTQMAIATLLLAPVGITMVPPLDGTISMLVVLSALFSMLGNLLLLYAYRLQPATRLAPMIYFQLIAAVVLGWLVFSELPDAYTWAGLALIISAGLASTRVR